MPEDMKKFLSSFRSLVIGIAIGIVIFFVLLFGLGLHTKIRRGEDGHRAIQMLDAMRRPFLEIKDAETRLIKSGNPEMASIFLEKGVGSANDMLERYAQLASYNPEVSSRVEELKLVYGEWVSVERHLFDHVSKESLPSAEGGVPSEHFLGNLNNATAGFLKTMASLGDGEGPIHGDIDLGRSAVHMLLILVSLLIAYVIALIFYNQYLRSLALGRSRSDLKEQVEVQSAAKVLLKDEKEYLETLHNALGETIFTVTLPERVVEFVNTSVESIFGYKPEECIGKSTEIFYPEGGAADFGRKLKVAMENGDEFLRTEHNLQRKNGEIFPAGITTTLFREEGEVTKVISMVRDISERKHAEQAHRESEDRYKQLIDNIDLGITLIDKDYNVVMANRYQGEMFNKASIELLGANCFKEFEKREDVCAHCPGARAMVSGKPEGVDTEGVLDDGSTVAVHIKAFPVFDADGEAKGFIEVVENITERKQMEAERLNSQKLESLGILAGGIAHDFNNLLAGILGNISLIKNSVDPEDKIYKRILESEKASLYAGELTKQLLTFAKGGEPVKEATSMGELIEESCNFALRGSNVKCSPTIADELSLVEVDRGQISQVINNILINARHAMPEGGIIDVSAENSVVSAQDNLPLNPGKFVLASIEDKGVGIPVEILPKIFDPYFTTKKKGSGLGLASAYFIIKKHDGHIGVESEVGTGTTVHIYLPRSVKELARTDAKEEVLITGTGRLLIMDDEEIIRDVASEYAKQIGFVCEVANDGIEVIEKYTKARDGGEPFDVVIMDLTVRGGMGGTEAVKRMLEIDPDARVIVSSGYSEDPVMSDYKKSGFCGVLAKPYTVARLSEVLDEAMKKDG